MSNLKTVDHKGIVEKRGDNFVTVQITSKSACAGCHAEGVCTLSGQKIKTIDIAGNYNLKEGDDVTVQMKQSMGYSAVTFGYLIPLVIVIVTLVVCLDLQVKESHAGIIALLSVFPYYLFLWLYKKRINKKFVFSLKI